MRRLALASMMAVLLPLSAAHAQDGGHGYRLGVAMGYGSFGDFCDDGVCPDREDALTIGVSAESVIRHNMMLGVTIEYLATPSVEAFGLKASSNVVGLIVTGRYYPVGGLHLTAGVGGASVRHSLSSGGSSITVSTFGALGSADVGYEARVTDTVQIGPFISARSLWSSEEGWANYLHGGLRLTVAVGREG